MNQSDWFSIDDVDFLECIPETQKNSNPQKIQLSKMEQQLSQYEQVILEQNLIKYIVKKSENNLKQVNEKSRIKIKCEEKDENGNLLNPLQAPNIIKVAMTSSIPQIIGFRKALLSMKEGDVAWYKISNELLQTPNDVENAPIIQTKYYYIQLEEVIETQQSLNVTTIDNRAIQLEKFKSEGNKLFQSGDYIGASSRYQRGLNFIEKWPKNLASDKQGEILKEDYFLVLTSNKAMALIKLQNYEEVVKILEPILQKIDQKPYKIKCYYRLISCLIQLQQFQRALDYIRLVKNSDVKISETIIFHDFEQICLNDI